MKRTLALLFAAVVRVGCGSNSPTAPPSSPTSSPVAFPTRVPAAAIVGRSERVVTCQELVSELYRAGLAPLAQYAWRGRPHRTASAASLPRVRSPPRPTHAPARSRESIRTSSTQRELVSPPCVRGS